MHVPRRRMRILQAAILLSLVTTTACGNTGEPPAAGADSSGTASEDAYPSQPIEFVTASNPGSGSDTMLRALLDTAEVPASTYVVNRAGSGGTNLNEYVEGRPADGYTVAAVTTSNVLSSQTDSSAPSLTEDWKPVIRLMVDPAVLVVHPDTPWQNIDDLVADMKTGDANFTGASVGSSTHISYVILAELTGSPTEQFVAYESSGDALPALLGGQAQAMVAETSEVADFVANGELRALAVEGQVTGFEDVPTFESQGYQEMVLTKWRGLMVRADTADSAVQYLHDTFKEAIEAKGTLWEDYLTGGGSLPGYMGPDEFHELLVEQDSSVNAILREYGVIE